MRARVSDAVRNLLIVCGMLLVALGAYTAARHWQERGDSYQRVASDSGCDLRQGPCRREVAGGTVVFAITPSTIPLMQPLALRVEVQGLEVDGATVELRGLNMDMGLNRTRLAPLQAGVWTGETILPVCSQTEMKWEAAVRIDGDSRLEIPFLFRTSRP